MIEFLQRLKQRKLVQWAAAYVAAAFALLQGIDIVAQQFGWPDGVRRGITLALVVGFFVTLVLAWYHGERGAQRVSGTELLILALLLALGGGFLWRFAGASRAPVVKSAVEPSSGIAIPEKSIAVLPFANLSGDPNNGFLSVGIQDEIITRLSKIAALKVISRTSTESYGSRPPNLPQIARELGVAAVLEGSVQKVGNQIRVNVQLIKAIADTPLWAETYDRELIDVLKVESDIAQEIAGALRAALTPAEKERLERKPTSNEEAYALYLKAIEALTRSVATSVPLEEAQHFLEQAVALDPSFALAHVRLSRIHTEFFATYQPTEVHKRSSKAEAEEALRLQPDLIEAHFAMGAYLRDVEHDQAAALREYDIARKISPNDSRLHLAIAGILFTQGDFRQTIVELETHASLDPRNAGTYDFLGNAYASIHDWAGAERAKKRAADLTTETIAAHFNEQMVWAGCYYELTGSFEKLNEVMDKVSLDPKDDPTGLIAVERSWACLQQRRYAEAEKAIVSSPVTIFEGWNSPRVTKKGLLGLLAMVQGDMDKARPLLENELEFARRELAATPDSANRIAEVATLCAYLGQKEEAIREGKRAVELLPIEQDAFLGPGMLSALAEIYGRVGEEDAAIDLLERLLTIPAGVSLLDLKNDWSWDPLRKNPRFQKILGSPEPKVIYR